MEMILSQLPQIVKRRAKRLGRGGGSGKGAKSTRGTTRHQRAREDIPLHFEGGQGKLTKRFPLLRGKSKNKSHAIKPYALDIRYLNIFDNDTTVSLKELLEKRLIPDSRAVKTVKIIGNAELDKKLTVRLLVSESARKIIEKAGGEVKQL